MLNLPYINQKSRNIL